MQNRKTQYEKTVMLKMKLSLVAFPLTMKFAKINVHNGNNSILKEIAIIKKRFLLVGAGL